MEGLENPKSLKNNLTFLFLESDLYSERVGIRYPFTQEVIKKNGFDYHVYKPLAEKRMSQAYETLIFGSFMVFHLTKLYKIDPIKIPWIDYFKKKLS